MPPQTPNQHNQNNQIVSVKDLTILKEEEGNLLVTDGRIDRWRELVSIKIPKSLIIARTLQGDEQVLMLNKVVTRVGSVVIGETAEPAEHQVVTITTYKHVAEKFQFKYEVLENVQPYTSEAADFDIDSM